MSPPDRQFSTGLPFLDRRLDGGVTTGTLLALSSPPHSQGDLLVRQLLRAHRTLYVSTLRPADEVRDWATAGDGPEPELTVLEARPGPLLEGSTDVRSALTPESYVVLDRTNGLEERPADEYLDFLNEFKAALRAEDCVGVLNCSETRPPPPRRGLTLDRADQVWQLEQLPLAREVKNRLLVTKSRHDRALTEPIDLVMTDRVQVDTSRRI